jgi:hypothetical protein
MTIVRSKKKQVREVPVTIRSIMQHPNFARGLADIRAGRSFDWLVDCWAYERGRLFGMIAPVTMPLRVKGKLNPKAVALCDAAFERRLVI